MAGSSVVVVDDVVVDVDVDVAVVVVVVVVVVDSAAVVVVVVTFVDCGFSVASGVVASDFVLSTNPGPSVVVVASTMVLV